MCIKMIRDLQISRPVMGNCHHNILLLPLADTTIVLDWSNENRWKKEKNDVQQYFFLSTDIAIQAEQVGGYVLLRQLPLWHSGSA